ncbi:hypothetical protein [Streptomyces sp. KS 21]|uniref:hypothetical protein n=1 Tax=Streptomyces sp. KS 21 TaxID=2485150 RepID=UPI001063437A|nr:hypothetical protein [Streptomyces sp. KS 21]TDU67949.1 hypothetical protein EDD91_8009 [Streptomyces sp. KS 21]
MRHHTTAPAALLGGHRLFYVPPQGLSLADRAAARRQDSGQRASWPFPAYDDKTPERAGFNAGIAYGLWGVEPPYAQALAALTGHLTSHAMNVLVTHRYIVTAVLRRGLATVSVLALQGRPRTITDPGAHPDVRRIADAWGCISLAAGPCLYAAGQIPEDAPEHC